MPSTTANPIARSLTVIGLASLVAAAGAGAACGVSGVQIAFVGAGATFGVYTLSELFLHLLGLKRPLDRLLAGMMVRAAGAAATVAFAVLQAGIEPKLIAGLAFVFYGSLIAGEVINAKRLEATAPGAAGNATAGGTN